MPTFNTPEDAMPAIISAVIKIGHVKGGNPQLENAASVDKFNREVASDSEPPTQGIHTGTGKRVAIEP
jgi:hypothetical protein